MLKRLGLRLALNFSQSHRSLARQILSLIDLTSLNDDDTEETITTLCHKAITSEGHVAAVCVYPRFVKQASEALNHSPVKIATVVNFPFGLDSLNRVLELISNVISDGANEIDLVFPLTTYLEGKKEEALSYVRQSKLLCGDAISLKTILETGAIDQVDLISAISHQVISAGADFLKTSTGKIKAGATIEAATLMLNAIRESRRKVGFKASGGIRTIEDASEYLNLADQLMGLGWVSPKTFRFGASQLLDRVFHVLDLG